MLYVLPFESTSSNSNSNQNAQTLQSQTKIVGTLPPNTVLSLLAQLLVLPMLVIAVNSPNLAHHHWGGGEGGARRQQSVSTILTETVVTQTMTYLRGINDSHLMSKVSQT